MRKILLAAALVAAFTATAAAQSYHVQTLRNWTAFVPASTATNIVNIVGDPNGATVTLTKSKTVAIYVAVQGDDTGSGGTVTFTFARSLDNVNFETLAANQYTVTLAATGTALTSKIVEFDAIGAGYLKLLSINNADTANLTNVVVKVGTKLGAF